MTAIPLAERMRPRVLDDVRGQEHLTGPDGMLRAAGSSSAKHTVWSGQVLLSTNVIENSRSHSLSEGDGSHEVSLSAYGRSLLFFEES